MLGNFRIGVRIGMGYAVLVALLMVIGVVAIDSIGQLSDTTNNLYAHPFAVTNALADANANIFAMRRSMKDVQLAKTPADQQSAIDDVDARERRVYQQFDIVRERFLGDKADVEAARKAFQEWKPVRDDMIRQLREGQAIEAVARNNAQSAEIERGLAKLMTFAMNKAASFAANAEARQSTIRATMIGLLAAGMLIGGLVAFVSTIGITRPLNRIKGYMLALAGGDRATAVPALERRDEIGEMARAVQVFREAMSRAEEMEAQARAEQEREIQRGRKRELLTADFDVMIRRVIDKLTNTVGHVHSTSQGLHAAADQTSSQSSAVAAAAEQAAANVRTVAAAAEELGSTTQEISRRVQDTTRITQEAVAGVRTADGTVEGLAAAAQKIGEIVSLINDIAAQTNLLALNATIEAARAGDAGKGFAVVAGEVKHLANQTARATSDIAEQINGIQATTRSTVEAIKAVGGAIGRVDEVVASIAAAVEQQNAATQEIARNVHEAAHGNMEVTRNISDVSQAAISTGDMAGKMYKVADELQEAGASLGKHVETFLGSVRVA